MCLTWLNDLINGLFLIYHLLIILYIYKSINLEALDEIFEKRFMHQVTCKMKGQIMIKKKKEMVVTIM